MLISEVVIGVAVYMRVAVIQSQRASRYHTPVEVREIAAKSIAMASINPLVA